MQVLLIALAVGILIYDAAPAPGSGASRLSPGTLLAAVLLPKAAVALLYWGACAFVLRRLKSRPRLLRWLDRVTGGYAWIALALYGVDLYLGWLVAMRRGLGETVLVDELATMAPTILFLMFGWWAYYPIDARLREASLIARIDSGLPVYPIWSRTQYLFAQLRHQVALVFLPLLLIMGWGEAVEAWVPEPEAAAFDPRPALVVVGSMGVFLATPAMLRRVWDTAPLPEGAVRERMLELCRRHGVRVRELLLWRTYGGMINAAVMGFLPPVRYILLTDALLDTLDRRHVEAVMAHELAHVRKRHMFWLLATAAATLGSLELLTHAAVAAVASGGAAPAAAAAGPGLAAALDLLASPAALSAFAAGVAVLGWVVVFGWVSRRVERQADAFAVQAIATERHEAAGADAGAPATITRPDVEAMAGALQRVAHLNHIGARRRSWRHGSIAWRQAYLRSLVGTRVGDVSVDRVVRRVQIATLAAAALLVLAYALLPADAPPLLMSL